MKSNEEATHVEQTLATALTHTQTDTEMAGSCARDENDAAVVTDGGDSSPAREDETDALSPAVRRLVRQYGLDVTGIAGTGPAGRIRVGDVMALIGSRAAAGAQVEGAMHPAGDEPDEPAAQRRGEARVASATPRAASTRLVVRALAASRRAEPISTIFECDVSRALAPRRRERQNVRELMLTSYFLVACAEALRAVPEVTDWAPVCFGVRLAATDGETRELLADTAEESPLSSLDDRLRGLDAQLHAAPAVDFGAANLLVHHYGIAGSVLATPLPLGDEHAACVGIGNVRRQIVVKEGETTPRVGAICNLGLTFDGARLTLERANRFMAHVVRVLEHWPD